MPENNSTSTRKKESTTSSTTTFSSSDSTSVTSPPILESDYVECPVCGCYIPEFYVEKNCPVCKNKVEIK